MASTGVKGRIDTTIRLWNRQAAAHSMSVRYIGHTLPSVPVDKVVICAGSEEIARHRRSYGFALGLPRNKMSAIGREELIFRQCIRWQCW